MIAELCQKCRVVRRTRRGASYHSTEQGSCGLHSRSTVCAAAEQDFKSTVIRHTCCKRALMPPVTLPCIDSIIDLIKVALILKNPELFEEWKVDIRMMAGRIIDMRRQLHHLLTNKPKTPGNCMHTLHDAVRPAMPSLPGSRSRLIRLRQSLFGTISLLDTHPPSHSKIQYTQLPSIWTLNPSVNAAARLCWQQDRLTLLFPFSIPLYWTCK